METVSTAAAPEPQAEAAVSQPKTFGELALRVTSSIYSDIHVNVAGFALFAIYGYGVVHPDLKDTCNQLAILAGTYLFASAKRK